MIVTIRYGRCHEALKWAKENCPNYVTNMVNLDSLTADDIDQAVMLVDFHFGHENDATLFALRWSNT